MIVTVCGHTVNTDWGLNTDIPDQDKNTDVLQAHSVGFSILDQTLFSTYFIRLNPCIFKVLRDRGIQTDNMLQRKGKDEQHNKKKEKTHAPTFKGNKLKSEKTKSEEKQKRKFEGAL